MKMPPTLPLFKSKIINSIKMLFVQQIILLINGHPLFLPAHTARQYLQILGFSSFLLIFYIYHHREQKQAIQTNMDSLVFSGNQEREKRKSEDLRGELLPNNLCILNAAIKCTCPQKLNLLTSTINVIHGLSNLDKNPLDHQWYVHPLVHMQLYKESIIQNTKKNTIKDLNTQLPF